MTGRRRGGTRNAQMISRLLLGRRARQAQRELHADVREIYEDELFFGFSIRSVFAARTSSSSRGQQIIR